MPVMLQLPGACDLQPLTAASACSDILSPLSSCPSASELLEIISAGGLELSSNRILLGDQLILFCAIGERDQTIELRGAQIEIARAQRRETVVDGALLIDLHGAFSKYFLNRLDGVLIKIRRDLLDC